MLHPVFRLQIMFKFGVLCLAAIVVGTLGFDEDRVVGSSQAARGQFPFIAQLRFVNGNTNQLLCGGSILHHRAVLTAAHCVTSENPIVKYLQIAVGAYRRSHDGVVHKVRKVIFHPQWDERIVANDVAILEPEGKIQFNQFVRPIKLPSMDTPNNVALTVVGWGQYRVSVFL